METEIMDAPQTAIVTRQRRSPLSVMADRFNIEPAKLLEVLKGTVIKATDRYTPTNEDIAAFSIVATQYNLNPFTKEIHAFADPQKGIVPIVGIDGWAAIVNREPLFDGCDFKDEAGPEGKPVAITCSMYVKNRSHPVRVTERYSECKRTSIPWNTMPWRMLRHKAFMQAARYAFSISGLYDEDEARDIVEGKATMDPPISRTDQAKALAAGKRNGTQTTQAAADEEPPAPTQDDVPEVQVEPEVTPEEVLEQDSVTDPKKLSLVRVGEMRNWVSETFEISDDDALAAVLAVITSYAKKPIDMAEDHVYQLLFSNLKKKGAAQIKSYVTAAAKKKAAESEPAAT